VLADRAESFIRGTPSGTPLLAYVAPSASHEPVIPAPRHASAYEGHLFPRSPAWNEGNVSDKPAWASGLPRVRWHQSYVEDYHETLLAADEGVSKILNALADTDRLQGAVIVLIGDNGFLFGEHRWAKKMVPYEEAIKVPFVIRADSLIAASRVETRLVANIDLAPTITSLAGAPWPGDGRSLEPLFPGVPVPWRSDFLFEHTANPTGVSVPSYCGVREAGFSYVHYVRTSEEELYDMVRDPWQQSSQHDNPSYAMELTRLRARERMLCVPEPPEPG
jgi:N-acetylglucosamine-6-sulfatase